MFHKDGRTHNAKSIYVFSRLLSIAQFARSTQSFKGDGSWETRDAVVKYQIPLFKALLSNSNSRYVLYSRLSSKVDNFALTLRYYVNQVTVHWYTHTVIINSSDINLSHDNHLIIVNRNKEIWLCSFSILSLIINSSIDKDTLSVRLKSPREWRHDCGMSTTLRQIWRSLMLNSDVYSRYILM